MSSCPLEVGPAGMVPPLRNCIPPADISRPGSDHTRLSGCTLVRLACATSTTLPRPSLTTCLAVAFSGSRLQRCSAGIGDLRRILALAQVLAELLARRVLAHLVDREAVPAAVNLERHLSALGDRDLLRREAWSLYEQGSAGPPMAPVCRHGAGPIGIGHQSAPPRARQNPQRRRPAGACALVRHLDRRAERTPTSVRRPVRSRRTIPSSAFVTLLFRVGTRRPRRRNLRSPRDLAWHSFAMPQ